MIPGEKRNLMIGEQLRTIDGQDLISSCRSDDFFPLNFRNYSVGGLYVFGFRVGVNALCFLRQGWSLQTLKILLFFCKSIFAFHYYYLVINLVNVLCTTIYYNLCYALCTTIYYNFCCTGKNLVHNPKTNRTSVQHKCIITAEQNGV